MWLIGTCFFLPFVSAFCLCRIPKYAVLCARNIRRWLTLSHISNRLHFRSCFLRVHGSLLALNMPFSSWSLSLSLSLCQWIFEGVVVAFVDFIAGFDMKRSGFFIFLHSGVVVFDDCEEKERERERNAVNSRQNNLLLNFKFSNACNNNVRKILLNF